MKRRLILSLLAVLALGLVAVHSNATPVYTVRVDEFGVGSVTDPAGVVTPLAGFLTADPTGGVTTRPVLVYTLQSPGAVIPGDVIMLEPGSGETGQEISDVIRFLPTAIIFYSDLPDELPAPPADSGLPLPGNPVSIPEDVDGNGFYTPTVGQPGFFSVDFTINYQFVSDTEIPPIPEPCTMIGLAFGVGLAFIRKRRSLA